MPDMSAAGREVSPDRICDDRGVEEDYTDHEDELTAELLDVIDGMVANGELELASQRDNTTVATRLLEELRGDPATDIAAWLLDQNVVTELYLDGDEVAARFAPCLARLGGDEPTPQWNEELAARARTDLKAFLVFGDWLQQMGDPRGELVHLQARRKADPGDEQLAQREAVFLRRYHRYLLGPLAEHANVRVTWSHGFIHTLEAAVDAYIEARDHPSLRFAIALMLQGKDFAPLAGHLPEQIYALYLSGTAGATSPPLHELVDGVAIRELTTNSLPIRIDLDRVRIPALRNLRLGELATLAGRGPDAWCTAFPSLEYLGLSYRPGWATEHVEAVSAVFARPPEPLAVLQLMGTHLQPWIRLLCRSPLLEQLDVLDLARSDVSGLAPEMRPHRAQLAHLEHIDLRDAEPPDAVAAIAQLHPNVLTGAKQRRFAHE
jgi:uncharacterized protein (TIGR02996 family)